MRGKSGSPFSSDVPDGPSTPRRRVGQTLLLGRAGSPSRAPEGSRGVRDHRRREQRDDPQRLEAVAEHRGGRVRVARLVQRPRLAILDVRVRVPDQLPDRAERRREKSSSSMLGAAPSNAAVTAVDERAVSRVRRARRRRSSSIAMFSTRFARFPKLFARSPL